MHDLLIGFALNRFSHDNLCLIRGIPVSPILLCSSPPLSYACLATLRVDFFKGLSVQLLNLRNGYFRSLTCSVCVAEVTQVNSISVSPIHDPGFPGS